MILQASPQDIVTLTRQLTMSFESLASVHNINLQFTGPEEPLMVHLEREHYEKIMTNLLFNALKFTPENGKVEVAVSLPTPNPSQEGSFYKALRRFSWRSHPFGIGQVIVHHSAI